MKRVVVTGLGLITALGTGLEKSWAGIISGKTGIKTIESFDTEDTPVKVAGEVRDFQPEEFGIEKKEIKKLARNTQFAIGAAKMALSDSGLTIDENNAERVGVIISSGIGGMEIFEAQHEVLLNKGPKRLSPFTIPGMIANMASGNVGIYLGAKGPNKSIVTACAAGTHSIGDAFETIKLGKADVMFAGGTEACITKFAVNSFANMKALSTNPDPNTASRPFTIDRDGFVMGEGAGVLVLEELEHALARNAEILAELSGYANTSDGYHVTSPDPSGKGAVSCMNTALAMAQLRADEIGYVNAHGTSTPVGDPIETKAIKEVFGSYIPPVSSTKGATGHLMGAGGITETIACIQAIRTGMLPPTLGYTVPDPQCDLDYIPNEARPVQIRAAMSNALGFGGQNSSVIVQKYERSEI